MTPLSRPLLACLLYALLLVLVHTPPALAAPPPESLGLDLRSSGLAFGRDVALVPGGQPVTVEVIAGERFRVSVSASHPSRTAQASIAVGLWIGCADGSVTQTLAGTRTATAGPGQVATVSSDIDIAKRRDCTVRHEVYASGQAAGHAEVQLPRATFVYDYKARPFGWVDLATGGPANVRVAGWAIEPETAAPTAVHVYVDGAFAGAATADGSRPDVGAAFPPYGPAHGFDLTVKARPGTRTVCVYAINTGDGTENPQIGCRTVSVQMPPGCRPIQDEINALQAEIRLLQAELRFAATGEKAALAAQIRALQARSAMLSADLEQCFAAA